MARQKEIRTDRTLVKEYVNEFISEITIHRMSKLWSLVIVHFIDGGEMWGTVKNFRYKKTEMFYDPALCSCPEYPSWFLNNQDLSLTYNKEEKTITYNGKSELYSTDFGQGVIEAGTYGLNSPVNTHGYKYEGEENLPDGLPKQNTFKITQDRQQTPNTAVFSYV